MRRVHPLPLSSCRLDTYLTRQISGTRYFFLERSGDRLDLYSTSTADVSACCIMGTGMFFCYVFLIAFTACLSSLPLSALRFRQTQPHQQAGSDPLLEAFLTAAVMDIFRNSDMFGGVLVTLTATLISEVANQDPSTTVAYLLR